MSVFSSVFGFLMAFIVSIIILGFLVFGLFYLYAIYMKNYYQATEAEQKLNQAWAIMDNDIAESQLKFALKFQELRRQKT